MSRRPIRTLAPPVILKIAAGEVIERPASVVKELIENSIDAGGRRISIRIADGGKELISVADDGIGMSAQDARLALEPHTTSKIETIEDLHSLQTLGFRGEALASISSVSHLDLITRTEDETIGTRIRMEGGELRSAEPFGTMVGTTLSISHLFFNTPARLKFLRSKITESGHIETVVRKIALIETGRSFHFENEGEIKVEAPAAKDLLERVTQLYGREIASKLIEIEGSEGPLSIRGFVSVPELTFGKADELWFFVNGRPFRDRMVQAAVYEGYRTARMDHRYPLAILRVSLPPAEVDVNVHPTKAEVRFAEPQRIFRLISEAVSRPLRQPYAVSPSAPLPPLAAGEMGLSYSIARPVESAVISPFVFAKKSSGRFGSLDYLGSLDQTYLVCREENALVLIDQHAAHERVQFENLRETSASKGKPSSQALLLPLTLELTAERAGNLETLLPYLSRLGFEIESFGPKSFIVKAIPEVLQNVDPRPLLMDLSFEELGPQGEAAWNRKLDDILSRIACHSAVRAHDSLSNEKVRSLLERMDNVDLASNCPHGRPTHLTFGLDQLERLFCRK